MSTPRELCAICLGDGEWPGLPGSDGAHTICSGVDALLSNDTFSLPSSNWVRSDSGSSDKFDEMESERSRAVLENPTDR